MGSGATGCLGQDAKIKFRKDQGNAVALIQLIMEEIVMVIHGLCRI